MTVGPDDRVWPGMAAGLVVSLLAHGGLGALAGSGFGAGADRPPRALPTPETASPVPAPDEIELGMNDSRHASITWLGVLEDPREGAGTPAEVDQAALTTRTGVEVRPSPVVPPRPEPIQPEPIQPAPAEPGPSELIPPAPAPSEPAVQPEQPVVVTPGAPGEPMREPVVERVLEPGPDPVLTPAELFEPPAEPWPVPAPFEPDTPVGVMGPPAPERDDEAAPDTGGTPVPPKRKDRVARVVPPGGDAGELSDREADAMRKHALDMEFDELGRPLAGKGLEIKTVRPDWPAAVRNTHQPHDAVIVIRFGADGKVRRAGFVREPDGSKGTGSREVDGPLIDAVYRWVAEGSRIEALNRDDPDAEVVVSIRVLLTRPVPGS